MQNTRIPNICNYSYNVRDTKQNVTKRTSPDLLYVGGDAHVVHCLHTCTMALPFVLVFFRIAFVCTWISRSPSRAPLERLADWQ